MKICRLSLPGLVAVAVIALTGCGHKDDIPMVEAWTGRDRKDVEAGKYNAQIVEKCKLAEAERERAQAEEDANTGKLTKKQMPEFSSMNPARDITRIKIDMDLLTSETEESLEAGMLNGEMAVAYLKEAKYEQAIPYAKKNVAILGQYLESKPELTINFSEACYRQALLEMYERDDKTAEARAFEALAYAKNLPEFGTSHSITQKYERLYALLHDRNIRNANQEQKPQGTLDLVSTEPLTKDAMPVFVSAKAPREEKLVLKQYEDMTSETRKTTESIGLLVDIAILRLRDGQYDAAKPFINLNVSILTEAEKTNPALGAELAEALYRQAMIKLHDRDTMGANACIVRALELATKSAELGPDSPVTQKYDKFHKILQADYMLRPGMKK